MEEEESHREQMAPQFLFIGVTRFSRNIFIHRLYGRISTRRKYKVLHLLWI